MTIRPIGTAQDHADALGEIARLWGADPGSEAGDRLDVLATLVDAYERDLPGPPELDPIELLQVTMDEEGYSQADLAGLLVRGPAPPKFSIAGGP